VNLRQFVRAFDGEIRQQELRRFIRSVALIEGLLILAVAAYCLLAPRSVSHAPVVFLAIGAFSLVCVLFRIRRFFPRQTRLTLAAESWAMVAFVTVVLWFSGGHSSPLLGLYLLPLTLTALALGRGMTLLQVAVVCAMYFALAAATPATQIWSSGYLGGAIVRLVPFLLIGYLTSTLAADIFAARRRIETLARTDPLTGLLNLRTFNEHLHLAHSHARAEREPYGLLMVDMDYLKDVNDEFGHDAGNAAIVLVADCIRRTVRTSDAAARFGGDEFVILLAGLDGPAADLVARRLRDLVSRSTLEVGRGIIACDVSIGSAAFPADGAEGRDVLALADERMYADKEQHRRENPRRRVPPGPPSELTAHAELLDQLNLEQAAEQALQEALQEAKHGAKAG